jgi:hypothetical protein
MVSMFNSRTHFEQVPLENIKKIVEEQRLAEAASAPYQEIDEEKLSEVLLEAEERSIAQPHTTAQEESLN